MGEQAGAFSTPGNHVSMDVRPWASVAGSEGPPPRNRSWASESGTDRLRLRGATGAWLRVGLVVASLVAYALLFVALGATVGPGIPALAVVPVAVASGAIGLRPALWTWLVVLSLQALLFEAAGHSGPDVVLRADSLASGLGMLVGPILVARMRRQREKAEGALAAVLTERRDVDEERRRVEGRLRALLRSSHDGLLLVDRDDRVVAAGGAALARWGYAPEGLLGRDFKDLHADPADPAWIRQDLGDGGGGQFEVRLRTTDDRKLICLETHTPWTDGQGLRMGEAIALADVTELRTAEETLRVGQQRLQLTMDAAQLATWDVDLATGAVVASNTLESLLGLEPHAYKGTYQALLERFHEEDRRAVKDALAGLVQGPNREVEVEARIIRPKEGIRWVSLRAMMKAAEADEGNRLVGTLMDITSRKRSEERVEHQGLYDPLTDLPNRRLFNQRIDRSLEQARRDALMTAVLFLDLDRFKVVNDTLGHAVGDRLLQEAAHRLAGCIRLHDTLARQGGDEFMVLVPAIRSLEEAETVAKRILDAFRAPFYIATRELHVTPSIGISVYPEDGDGPDPLLRNADAAMYRVKAAGRNGYQFHTPAMYADAFGRLELEAALRAALEGGEFLVFYQPQVSLTTGRLTGVEALVRWESPKWGKVSPERFIPLAEETGLIVPLGEWVLRTACIQFQDWLQSGLPPLRLAVNISARQFEQPDLVDRVTRLVRETGIDPKSLKLEITETTAMKDVARSQAILRELADAGIQAGLDDFGTGHASLHYLRDFPLYTLKIDRGFVADLPNDTNDAAICAAVIALAHALNLSVIAEGVETQAQVDFLRRQHCDEAQGYLFSAPVSPEELVRLAKTDHPDWGSGDPSAAVGSPGGSLGTPNEAMSGPGA